MAKLFKISIIFSIILFGSKIFNFDEGVSINNNEQLSRCELKDSNKSKSAICDREEILLSTVEKRKSFVEISKTLNIECLETWNDIHLKYWKFLEHLKLVNSTKNC